MDLQKIEKFIRKKDKYNLKKELNITKITDNFITIAISRLETMKEEYELEKFDKEKRKKQRIKKMMNQKYLREPLMIQRKEMPKNLPGKE